MNKNVFVVLISLLLLSCAKHESVFLDLKVSEVLKGNFFPFEEYHEWEYYKNDDLAFRLNTNGPYRTYAYGAYDFLDLGTRRRTTLLFGGVGVWERFNVKRADTAVVLQIIEQYDFATVLKSVPYAINLYTKNIALGTKWQDTRNIEYTQFQQWNSSFIHNLVYPTTLYYEVIGFNETKTILGTEYKHVITYRIDYEVNSTPLYREFMLAKDVGIVSIKDEYSHVQLRSYY